jgi:pyruvate,water dikinase
MADRGPCDLKTEPTSIHWLGDIGDEQADLVGGKGIGLARLVALEVPVPPGFCVSVEAYQRFIEDADLASTMERFLRGLNVSNLQTMDSQSAELQKSFLAADVPHDLVRELDGAYLELAGLNGDSETRVAVRSSATAEDLPGASFAGQHDTYLGVMGRTALADAVKRCWASLWNFQAVHYRHANEIDHAHALMSVVVQQMVPSVSAGVLFTANPISGDVSEMIINASWGLGESVVGGSVDPDTFVVDKVLNLVKTRSIAFKESSIEPAASSGTREVAVLPAYRDCPSLTDDQAVELGRLAIGIEEGRGTPQDIEWAHDGSNFHILQARPITT